MKKQYIVLIAVVSFALLFVLGSNLYKQKQIEKYGFMAETNASVFVRDHSQTFGSEDAKVFLVEFTDPGCETCSAFHPFVKQLINAYPGKIKLVVRYAPLHKGADYMVKVLEAARKQGKYWETLEVMYQTQDKWASHDKPQPELIWNFLPQAGLDLDKIRKDMTDPAIAKIIEQDLSDAKSLNVKKTPEFFVNGRPLSSFGHQQLQQLVESEIKEKY
jgi:protein-disulfide isomerase